MSMPFEPGKTVRSPEGTCAACLLHARCTASSHGLSVSIHPDEALLAELRQRQQDPHGRASAVAVALFAVIGTSAIVKRARHLVLIPGVQSAADHGRPQRAADLRNAPLVADPTPVCPPGSEPMADSVADGMVSPAPTLSTIMPGRTPA